MNQLDLLLILIIVVAGVVGWQLGFARRVLSWVGLIGGLAAASWLLPRVLEGQTVPAGPTRFLVSAGILFAGAMVGQFIGSLIGARLRGLIGRGRLGRVDAGLGVVAGLAGVVVVLWVVLPAMADVPGWPARAARGSAVARTMHDTLGDPPGLLDNLADSLGLEGLPRVFEDLQTAPEVAAPPANSPVAEQTVAVAGASTLRIVSRACDRIQSGSGFVVSPGLVVTNAHVVAGSETVRVESADGSRFAAEVVAFDGRSDLAVLRSPSLGSRAALPLSDAEVGDVGVVIGYPGGGPVRVNNFLVGERVRAQGRDIYDQATVVRTVLVLGADLAPGDSGGPLIDPQGQVIGVAFAIAPDKPQVAYAISTDQVRYIVGRASTTAVAAGACLN